MIPKRSGMRISVVMPECNVGGKVDEVVRRASEAISYVTKDYEIILVDDGSEETKKCKDSVQDECRT